MNPNVGEPTEQGAPVEPVRIPIDDQGNPLPVKSFTDLVERNNIEHYDDGVIPEAGGIAWTDANLQIGEKGLVLSVNKFNLTARNVSPLNALDDLLLTLAYAEKLGIKVHLERSAITPSRAPSPVQAAQALGGVEKPVANTNTKAQPKPQLATAPAPQAPTQQPAPNAEGGGIARIVKVVVTPLPGGKYVLKFHESGHPKYPDYSTYKSGIDLDAALAVLNKSGYVFEPDMLHPTQEVSFEVNCELAWKYSDAVNSKGNHYKNFVQLFPIGG